jgi:5S rRNA maturation endonuclease (ribonuclease M5)
MQNTDHDPPIIKTNSIQVRGSKTKQSRLETSLPPSSLANTNRDEIVFSSQKSQFADYTTWKGIENKTGIEKDDAVSFLVKELLDNAFDYLETGTRTATNLIKPEIHVVIERSQEKYVRITVCNSSYQNNLVFTSNTLKSIFDFDRYHSSKRNQFKITKGALGDALKEVLCIPNILAHEAEIANWNYPLYVISQQKLYQIQLITDRINQIIYSQIKESDSEIATTEIQHYHPECTQIILTLPIINNDYTYTKLYRFVLDYAMFATHVKLTFEDKNNEMYIEFPQLQQINSKWKNYTSIYCYRQSQFHEFILGLDNNDLVVYDVLYSTFREATNMPRSQITQMTVGQLKHSTDSIDKLYDELRNSMSPPAALTLPFDVIKKVRTKALEHRVSDIYGSFKEMKYKSTTGFYSDGKGTQIPFYFEIAIFHDVWKLQNNNLVFRQAINGSAIPNTGWTPFSGCKFEWTTKGSKNKYISNSIYDIFAHFGYAYSKDKCRKPHSLIIANLICPKIDYQSYGKSRINFSPFADEVAKTVVLACMGGGGHSQVDGRPTKRDVLLEILENRKYKWNSMDVQKLKNWWTQSDVFYATRKLLIETYHYPNEEVNRDYITGMIKLVCEDDLDVKREDIGILAADRAQLYFRGKWMDVGLKEIEQLSMYGIALLIIEKEGVAEQLSVFADEKGIALLNTRGFLTEYAEILSKKSEEEGCKVAILTDFDASGLVLAAKAPNAYRIGIDFETLEDLELDIKGVEEQYTPENKHLKPLEHGGKLAGLYPKEWIGYVATKRVEINSVTEELNDNQNSRIG